MQPVSSSSATPSETAATIGTKFREASATMPIEVPIARGIFARTLLVGTRGRSSRMTSSLSASDSIARVDPIMSSVSPSWRRNSPRRSRWFWPLRCTATTTIRKRWRKLISPSVLPAIEACGATTPSTMAPSSMAMVSSPSVSSACIAMPLIECASATPEGRQDRTSRSLASKGISLGLPVTATPWRTISRRRIPRPLRKPISLALLPMRSEPLRIKASVMNSLRSSSLKMDVSVSRCGSSFWPKSTR